MNEAATRRDIVVIGASAGGVETLMALFSKLPAGLPATVMVVIHRSPVHEGRLAYVFGRKSALPVSEPRDGEPLKVGCIYVAPRDHHLLVDDGAFRLNRGPKEHHTRPAVDPLFKTAAVSYAERVVGVLVSGGGDDGVSGLMAIKQRGGLTMVQDLDEAPHPSMPMHALLYDHVDAVLRIDEMASALTALVAGGSVDVPPPRAGGPPYR